MPSILPALRALLFASALLPLMVIAGCGLKGDLVLADPDSASSSPPEIDHDEDEDGDSQGRRSPSA